MAFCTRMRLFPKRCSQKRPKPRIIYPPLTDCRVKRQEKWLRKAHAESHHRTGHITAQPGRGQGANYGPWAAQPRSGVSGMVTRKPFLFPSVWLFDFSILFQKFNLKSFINEISKVWIDLRIAFFVSFRSFCKTVIWSNSGIPTPG